MRMLFLVLAIMACNNPPTPATRNPQPATPQPRITFPDHFTITLEIAANDELRAQGLMYRDHLDSDKGMLFVFPEDGDYAFWMKDTRIPLDMIWIDSNRKVVHVKHQVPPCKVDDCPSYPPGVKARYVLEVPGGVAKQHGVKAGDALRFEGTENIRPQ